MCGQSTQGQANHPQSNLLFLGKLAVTTCIGLGKADRHNRDPFGKGQPEQVHHQPCIRRTDGQLGMQTDRQTEQELGMTVRTGHAVRKAPREKKTGRQTDG
jgi:hypothetical protein